MTTDSADTVVVLTALNSEYEAVRTLLDDPKRYQHRAGTIFEVGGLSGQPGLIALAEIGPGNQSAAALTERAITMFRPRAVLFVGVAGALDNDLDLGAVVVATKVYGYHGGTDETDSFRTHPQSWETDHELNQLAREINRTGRWKSLLRDTHTSPPVHFTPIAAGEVVLNSRDTPLAKQLHNFYADAAAIEMESAGMASAAHLNRLPCLAIRGISDKADGRKYTADDAERQKIAAANAAAFAITLARSALTSRMESPSSDTNKKRMLIITITLALTIAAAVIFTKIVTQWNSSSGKAATPTTVTKTLSSPPSASINITDQAPSAPSSTTSSEMKHLADRQPVDGADNVTIGKITVHNQEYSRAVITKGCLEEESFAYNINGAQTFHATAAISDESRAMTINFTVLVDGKPKGDGVAVTAGKTAEINVNVSGGFRLTVKIDPPSLVCDVTAAVIDPVLQP